MPTDRPVVHQRAPARIGDALGDIDTPALLIARPIFDANLRAVAGRAAAAGLALRPHGKAHKCVAIAREQIAAGAIGICCQKVSEAEAFVRGGVTDVLVSNQVVGERKLRRLAALARTARVGICVDDVIQIEQLARVVRAEGVVIEVFIEIDVGSRRCGIGTPAEALDLYAALKPHADHLPLRGLQAYQGAVQHVREAERRAALVARAATLAREVQAALTAAGADCAIITGAGTGSYVNELASGVYTEIQPGSYVLMDADYVRNEADAREPALGQALTVLCTVISAQGDRAVVDAGLKALSAESGLPVSAEPGWRARSISDEHVVLVREEGVNGRTLRPGDRLQLVPSHCDPTVNLHDWIIVVADERVTAVWPVDARGAVF